MKMDFCAKQNEHGAIESNVAILAGHVARPFGSPSFPSRVTYPFCPHDAIVSSSLTSNPFFLSSCARVYVCVVGVSRVFRQEGVLLRRRFLWKSQSEVGCCWGRCGR